MIEHALLVQTESLHQRPMNQTVQTTQPALQAHTELAHWLQIFGPGRYEGHYEETKLEKIEEIIQHEEQIDPQVRLFYQHLTTSGLTQKVGFFFKSLYSI